jgi:hypothetical protein
MGLRVITQRSASSSLHFYVCEYTQLLLEVAVTDVP